MKITKQHILIAAIIAALGFIFLRMRRPPARRPVPHRLPPLGGLTGLQRRPRRRIVIR